MKFKHFILVLIFTLLPTLAFAGFTDLRTSATGTGAMSFSLSDAESGLRVKQIIFVASPAITAAEAVTCETNSGLGTAYDGGQVSSGSMAAASDWILNLGDVAGYSILSGDSFDCTFTNSDGVNWYLIVIYVKE